MGTATITYLVCDGIKGKNGCGKEIRSSREGVLLTGTLHDGGPLKSGISRPLLIESEGAAGPKQEIALCTACLSKLLQGLSALPAEPEDIKALRKQLDVATVRAADAEARAVNMAKAVESARIERDDAKAALRRKESSSSSSSSSSDDYGYTAWERRGGGPSGPQSPPELEESVPHYLRVATKLSCP